MPDPLMDQNRFIDKSASARANSDVGESLEEIEKGRRLKRP
ncbi:MULTISPECIES: hypothetical protein [unclassified Marinovum]